MVHIIATDRQGKEHRIAADVELSLMENLRTAGGLDIAAICGGSCSCGTCHIYVDPAWLPKLKPQEPDEAEILDFAKEVQPNSRLACQIRNVAALDGIKVRLAPE